MRILRLSVVRIRIYKIRWTSAADQLVAKLEGKFVILG